MKKEELVNIISARLSSQGKETAVAFDVFLQKVAESLEVNESVKIPEVGIFQLKKKGTLDESGSQGKGSFYLLFVPLKYNRKDKNEVLAFQVNPRNLKKTEIDDDVFSLSVDQPVIPVTEQARKEFLVHSSYLMMQKNFEDRVDGMLLNSVNLSDFEIDHNFSAIPEENKFGLAPEPEKEAETEDNESIPWDFGEEDKTAEIENTLEASDEKADEDFDAIVASITDDFSDGTPALDTPADEAFMETDETPDETDQPSETEEVLNEIMPGDSLKNPDDLFKDLLGEDELPEDEIPVDETPVDEVPEKPSEFQGSSELGEDWFSLKEIDDDEEEASESENAFAEDKTFAEDAAFADGEAFAGEKAFTEEEPFAIDEPTPVDDQAENIDEKLELLTEMDAGLEIDPFEDFSLTEEDEKPVEEELTEELIEEEPAEEKPAEEEPAKADDLDTLKLENDSMSGITLTDDKMLEDEDEAAHKVKYPGTFWMILGALVLVTLGGVYYFFFMGKSNPLLPEVVQKKTAAEKVSDIKPQIIERDYSVPVTVYKRSAESPQELQKYETESADAEDENNTKPQNTAPAENKPLAENKTTPGNTVSGTSTAPKTGQEKKPENRQQTKVTKLPETNVQVNKPVQKTNTPVQKNNTFANKNSAPKQNQTVSDLQIQPRGDTKDKLIKKDIFTDGRGRYTIQESSWQSASEAVKRVKYFKSRGLDAYYTKYAPKGAKVWYRVRIGDFPSLEETENTLKRIR
ncbi:MAG TPA: SPOR domain-containing protein [Ignavibacteriales bacterium]|nr:SPOR domain-containing protein [Ignavibacteriales bacterium]